ncbi:MAG: AAA family ATPase [Pseudomonadota bacterium]
MSKSKNPGNDTPEALFPEGTIYCAADIDPAQIKPRQGLLGGKYQAGGTIFIRDSHNEELSLLAILEGLSVASGKKLTHARVWQRGPAWYYGTEDPVDEIERRILAAKIHHKLTDEDVAEFYYSSGYDLPLKLVEIGRCGPVVNETVVQTIITEIQKRGVLVFLVDPLMGCLDASEGDHQAMEMLMQALQRVATTTGCAVGLFHTTVEGEEYFG